MKIFHIASDESTTSKVRIYKWVKRFLDSCENVEDDECPGRLSTITADDYVEKVKKTIMDNLRIIIRDIVDDVGILVGLCYAICTDILSIKHVEVKFFPKLLNFEQRIHLEITKRRKQRSKTAKMNHN